MHPKKYKFKRDWAKNNTIILIQVINTVLYEKLLFMTTRKQWKTTNGLETLKQYCSYSTNGDIIKSLS